MGQMQKSEQAPALAVSHPLRYMSGWPLASLAFLFP